MVKLSKCEKRTIWLVLWVLIIVVGWFFINNIFIDINKLTHFDPGLGDLYKHDLECRILDKPVVGKKVICKINFANEYTSEISWNYSLNVRINGKVRTFDEEYVRFTHIPNGTEETRPGKTADEDIKFYTYQPGNYKVDLTIKAETIELKPKTDTESNKVDFNIYTESDYIQKKSIEFSLIVALIFSLPAVLNAIKNLFELDIKNKTDTPEKISNKT